MSPASDRAVLDHRLVLLHPFVPGDQFRPEALAGAAPCARSASPALTMYLAPQVLQTLHRHRWALRVDAVEQRHGWRVDQAEVALIADDLAVLSMVLTLTAAPSLGELLAAVDRVRLRAPWWPDQVLADWRPIAGQPAHTGSLVRALIGDQRPVFDDNRLLHLVFAALPGPPSLAVAYSLTVADTADMPPPPSDELDRFSRQDAYRRWESAGTQYTFAHHGAAITRWLGRDERPPEWLPGLVGNQYLDLASWVCCVAARRAQLFGASAAGGLDPSAWGEHRRQWEWPRVSEQDQARQIVRTWLDVIERDRMELSRLWELARER